MKLLPIQFSTDTTYDQKFDLCNAAFRSQCLQPDNRPILKGSNIIFTYNSVESKTESFWHAASLSIKDENKSLSVLPCNNDISSSFCDDNCTTYHDRVTLSNGDVRIKCLYRASRIAWIREIVNMYNEDDDRIHYWEASTKEKIPKAYLRYIEDENDYIVIFELKKGAVLFFLTAFPVFLHNFKKDFTAKYSEYMKSRQS